MPSNLTGPAIMLCNVLGDANAPALYFISQDDYNAFAINYYGASTFNYYDNTGTFAGSATLYNMLSYAHQLVNLPVNIETSGVFHTVIMSTGPWNISDADLTAINAAISEGGGATGLVSIEGAVPIGLQSNYPASTNGVTLTGVQPQIANLSQACNIISNQYQTWQV